MKTRFDPLLLADVASEQWGMLTTAQARAAGATTQQVADLATAGHLDRLRHGVYRISGTPGHPDDDLRAAWLAIEPARTAAERLADAEPAAVVSHRSAALLHGIGDLDADQMEFTTRQRRQNRRGEIRYHVGTIDSSDWTLVHGLPATTVAATIADLAAGHIDGSHLASMVRDAISGGQATPDEISAALRPHAHQYGAPLGDGVGLVARLLEEAGAPPTPSSTAAAVFESIADALRSTPDLDPHWTPAKGLFAGLSSSDALVGVVASYQKIANQLAAATQPSGAMAAAIAGLSNNQKEMVQRMAAAGTLPSSASMLGLSKDVLERLKPAGLTASQLPPVALGLSGAAIRSGGQRAIESAAGGGADESSPEDVPGDVR